MKLIWITKAFYKCDYRIEVEFSDGLSKEVNLENSLCGSALEPLKDLNLFKQFKLSDWSIEWPNGADISPEYLYSL